MKRLLIFVGLAGLFIAGCGEDNMTCKRTETFTQNGEQLKNEYVNKISYNEKYVTKEHQILKTYSSIPSVLNDPHTKKIIANLNKLDGCDATLKIDGDTLTATLTIDYAKINIDELDELHRYLGHNLIKNGKIKIDDLQENYENYGFTCEQ